MAEQKCFGGSANFLQSLLLGHKKDCECSQADSAVRLLQDPPSSQSFLVPQQNIQAELEKYSTRSSFNTSGGGELLSFDMGVAVSLNDV